MTAENVRGFSTPAARVTWSTTVPPQCVTSVRVEFRISTQGDVVTTNTTNDTSETEIIQTGLQCDTNYYITVVVTGATSDGGRFTPNGVQVTLNSRQVQMLTGEIYHYILCNHSNMTICHLYRYTTAIRTES